MSIMNSILTLSVLVCALTAQASQVSKKNEKIKIEKPLIYSQHAQDRMSERNRSAKDVQDALASSIPYESKRNDGKKVYINAKSGTKVVVNEKKNKIVTVIAKKPKFQTPWNPQNDENYKLDSRLLQQYKGKIKSARDE